MTSSLIPLSSSPTEANDALEAQDADSAQKGSKQVHSLPTVLTPVDIGVFILLTVVFISNTVGVQFGGPSAFVYWLLGMVTFLVPTAYATQWLIRRFPGPNGMYALITQVLGSRWAFMLSFCAWICGTLATVAAIEGCVQFLQVVMPMLRMISLSGVLILVIILAVCTALACLPLRWLKRGLLATTVVYLGSMLLEGGIGLWWLASGHHAAIAFSDTHAWLPSSSNVGIYGIVILALLGVNMPFTMSGEITGGVEAIRRSRHVVWWASIIACVAYVASTFGIMVVVPAGQAGQPIAYLLILQDVFGQQWAMAGMSIPMLGYVSIIILYIIMFSRRMVIVAGHNWLPTRLVQINRAGVPIFSILAQCSILFVVTSITVIAIPNFFANLVSQANLVIEGYNILQAVASMIWTVYSVVLLLLPLLALRLRKAARPGKVGSMLLWTMTLTGCAASLVGLWDTLLASWIPSLIPNSSWAILVAGITFFSLASGWFGSEVPRVYALLNWQRSVNHREVELREQLQEAYAEQEILVLQQRELLNEVDKLYREQSLAAITDAVTGLPNHRAVMSRLDEELARGERLYVAEQETCAILFVDLDHFKQVNDTWGHRAGDAILREVANRLRAVIRQEDFVGRYGGEEFAVILVGTDVHAASQAAERLRQSIVSRACIWQCDDGITNVEIQVTASIGVAIYGLHGVAREVLISHADNAMYQAKRNGRNQVRVADVLDVVDVPSPATIIHSGEVGTVHALTAAASARDESTNEHAHRMVMLADVTAHALSLSEDEVHLVRLGALLHDIGKIGIPDAILHKPGPLTSDEWAVMRRHPEIGREILMQAGGIFSALASIVVAHHERWDGGGYPSGIKGDAIPFAARILTVIDSYDAMISPRVYKQPMSIAAARAELQRCAGSQYDPHVVQAFLAVLDAYEGNEAVGTHNADEQMNLVILM